MWRLQVGLKCRLVHINFVQPDTVGVGCVLNHIKTQTAGFVVHRTLGVIQHSCDKLFLVAFFDLDRYDNDVHVFFLVSANAWVDLIRKSLYDLMLQIG